MTTCSQACCVSVQDLFDRHEASADLTHVNMLCELLMRAKQPQEVLSLIQGTAINMCGAEGLPVELQVTLPSPGVDLQLLMKSSTGPGRCCQEIVI